jgi:hypothetical protein
MRKWLHLTLQRERLQMFVKMIDVSPAFPVFFKFILINKSGQVQYIYTVIF